MIKQKIGNPKDGATRAQPYSITRIALFSFACFALLICVRAGISHADGAAFDLAGPPVEMRVTRDGKTLPISRVANLQPGDRLWIHPALPDTQSVHYLLVVAFLRGSTNPPPETWFTRVETWTKQAREEGIVVTVPQDAQQALLFLAPETGGDFNTLRNAVRGRYGRVRESVARSEPGQPGSFAPGSVFGRRECDVERGSRGAEGTLGFAGAHAEHQS